jgi:hypothetical protein
MLIGDHINELNNIEGENDTDVKVEPIGTSKANIIIPTPNRYDRRIKFGIDVAEMVHFTHWEPGGEHVKQLVVKNVVMKTQKIKYKLPKTRFYYT